MTFLRLWQPNPATNPNHILMLPSPKSSPTFIRECKIGGNLWTDGDYVESESVCYSILRFFL